LQARDKLLATAPGGTEKEKGEDVTVKMMQMIGSNVATETRGLSDWTRSNWKGLTNGSPWKSSSP
jgi:hypothetical protein